MKFVISERKLIYLLYFFVYTFCLFYYLYNGVIDGDLRGLTINQPWILFISYIEIVFFSIVFLFFYEKINSSIRINSLSDLPFDVFHYFVLIINMLYVFFSVKYNFGFSGIKASSNMPIYYLYFFILLQPLYFSYLYFAYFIEKSNVPFVFYFNVILVLCFSIYKGWLGPVIYISIIFLSKYWWFVKANLKRFMLYFVFLIIISPFLKFFKDVFMILNQSESVSLYDAMLSRIEYLNFHSFWDFFTYYIIKTIGRFDHVAITYYANVSDINIPNNIRSVLSEGWLGERLTNALGYDLLYIQRYIAYLIENAYTWQVHIPLPTRILLLPEQSILTILYTFIVCLISIVLSKLISNNKSISLINWYAMFALAYHGWFYSAILWIQAMIIFLLFLSIYKFLVNISN